LDASAAAIKAAQKHAALSDVSITYVCGSVEAFTPNKKYDIVTALEILEHVADLDLFLRSAAKLLKPDGVLLLSTVNRTVKSYVLGIVAAEYVLRWVQRGTHDWRKFLRPAELDAALRQAGLKPTDIVGMRYDPFNDSFHLHLGAVGVNYLMTAVKA
jgi:2-polyprenyl-6-hydroxyphenyl methylase/3-demethylubiquinone-9 3-methyltransferase